MAARYGSANAVYGAADVVYGAAEMGTLVGMFADGDNPNAFGTDDTSGLTGRKNDSQAAAFAYYEQGYTYDSGGPANPNADPGMPNGPWCDVPIASATYASSTGIATINTTLQHWFQVEQFFSIYGATDPKWNGTWQVLAVNSPTQFTALLSPGPTGAVTGGHCYTAMYHKFGANRLNTTLLANTPTGGDTEAARMGRSVLRSSQAQLSQLNQFGDKTALLWGDIANGDYDTQLIQIAQSIAASPLFTADFPYMNAFFHEMPVNNDHQRGQGDPGVGSAANGFGCGYPDTFVTAWRHVRDIFDAQHATILTSEGKPNGGNVMFIWTPIKSVFKNTPNQISSPWNWDPCFNQTYTGTGAGNDLAGDGLAWKTTAYGTLHTAIAATPSGHFSAISITIDTEQYVPLFKASTWFKIDNEYFIGTNRVDNGNGTVTWLAQRAMGTTAAAHSVGTAVRVINRYYDVIGLDAYGNQTSETATELLGGDNDGPDIGGPNDPPGSWRHYVLGRGCPCLIEEWGLSDTAESFKAQVMADSMRKLKLWWNGPWGIGSCVHFDFSDIGAAGVSATNFFTTSREYSATAAFELQHTFFGGPRGGLQAPQAPTGLVAVPGSTTVDLDWNDNPASEQITEYHLHQITPPGAPDPIAVVSGTPPGSTIEITGLTPSTLYTFTVTAVNAAGESAHSSSVTFTTTSGGGGPGSGIGRVQEVGRSTTGTGQVKPAWKQPTQAGNLLLAVVSLTSDVANMPIPPTGWKTAKLVPSVAGQLSESIAVFYINNAASRSGQELFTAQTGTPDMAAILIEVSGIRAVGALDVQAFAQDATVPGSAAAQTGQTPNITFNDEYVVAAIAVDVDTSCTNITPGFARVDNEKNTAISLFTWDMVTRVPAGSLILAETLGVPAQWAGVIVSFKGSGSGRYMRRSGTLLGMHDKLNNQGAQGSSQTVDCGNEDNRWSWYAFGRNSDGSAPVVTNPYPIAHHLETKRLYSGFPTPDGNGNDPTPNRNSTGGVILPLGDDLHHLCRGRVMYHNVNAQYGPDQNHVAILWADVALGKWDNFLYSCANGLKALGPVTGGGDGTLSRAFPYLFSFQHDSGINAPPSQPGRLAGGLYSDYKNAYRHVREVFDAAGITVYSSQLDAQGRKVLNPNGFVFFCWMPAYKQYWDKPNLALVGQDKAAAYTAFLVDPMVGDQVDGFPFLGGPGGKDYYDIVGTDPYPDTQKVDDNGFTPLDPQYYMGDPTAPPATGSSTKAGSGMIPYALARAKPIWIGEYGPQHMTPEQRTTFFTRWMDELVKGEGFDTGFGIFPNYLPPQDPLDLPESGSFVGITFTDEPAYEFDTTEHLPSDLVNDPYLQEFKAQGELAFFGGHVGLGAGEGGGGGIIHGLGNLISAGRLTGTGTVVRTQPKGVGHFVSVGALTGQGPNDLFPADTTAELGTDLSVLGNIEIGKAETDIVTFRLTVSVLGGGEGIVTSSPAGIDTGADEAFFDFPTGSVVTLFAEPTGGSRFLGWGGEGSGTGSIQVMMNHNVLVTADFELIPANHVGTLVGVGRLDGKGASRRGHLVSASSLFGVGTIVAHAAEWQDEFATDEGVTPWSGRRVTENIGPMGD